MERRMNPDCCSDLYPVGYLSMIEQIKEQLLNSCSNNPTDEEIQDFLLSICKDVISSINY